MSNITKIEVLKKLKATGIVPVFYHADLETCIGVIQAAYEAGIPVFEFTNRGENAYDLFVAIQKYATEKLPGMVIGVGSIIDAATTEKFIAAGAEFIVSPVFVPEMGTVCIEKGIAWLPGCMTLTEMVNASKAGADIVKLFPGSALGPKFVSAVLAPLPWLQIMPTGGVEPTEQNLTEWFKSGIVCCGLGGQLFNKEHLASKNFTAIKDAMKNALALSMSVRGM
jgi:2-dehydro-3-deoxyphosphogluconate aldolase / (4S)-4-hydroxy-2-oxoglutarate aldolase